MTPDKLFVAAGGFGMIAAIYWFFFMKQTRATEVAGDSIDIIVDGGYSPEAVSIPKDKTTVLNFIRRDPSSCLEEVTIPDFKKRLYLPMNKTVSVRITPRKTGTFSYSCGMNMFHGTITVI